MQIRLGRWSGTTCYHYSSELTLRLLAIQRLGNIALPETLLVPLKGAYMTDT